MYSVITSVHVLMNPRFLSLSLSLSLSLFSSLPAINRFMVDAADHEKLDASKNELHSLLDKPQLSGIPVGVNNDCLSETHIHTAVVT